MKNPRWDSNPRTQDSEADVEPRWLMMPTFVWSVCGLCAKCDHAVFTANKNVALLASTITALQSAKPTNSPNITLKVSVNFTLMSVYFQQAGQKNYLLPSSILNYGTCNISILFIEPKLSDLDFINFLV